MCILHRVLSISSSHHQRLLATCTGYRALQHILQTFFGHSNVAVSPHAGCPNHMAPRPSAFSSQMCFTKVCGTGTHAWFGIASFMVSQAAAWGCKQAEGTHEDGAAVVHGCYAPDVIDILQ